MIRRYFHTAFIAALLLWTCGGWVCFHANASHVPAAIVSQTSSGAAFVARLADNPDPPASPVKLIFIHHSTGGNWLGDPNPDQPGGGLGRALMDNNYFVSAANYGWGPYGIGDRTDIPNWPEWFTGPNSGAILSALYAETGQNFGGFGYWPRLSQDPGGENQVIMFKSCYPNSDLYGQPNDPPAPEPNEDYTVRNAKAVYNNLLTYFQTRQDKLFIVITAPPMAQGEYAAGDQTPAQRAANARALNDWLVGDWLDGYPYSNVAVFDYYNVLTSNGSASRVDDPQTNEERNDADWDYGNHHRWWNGAEQHMQTVVNDYSAYPTDTNWDSHPTAAGHQKATTQFVQLLNVFYHRWMAGGVEPTPTATGIPPGPTRTPTNTPTSSHTPERTSTSTHTATKTATATGVVIPTVTRTQPAGQYTMVFQQGVGPDASYAGASDVILANDAEPNANLGGMDYVETFYGAGEEHRRSLLRWDLSALPTGITISSAEVELYCFDGNAENEMDLALYGVTRNWTEGTGIDLWPDASYVPDGATWSLAGPDTAWTTPGGDLTTSSVCRVTLPAGMGNGWVTLDATAAVRAWVERGVPNRGLAVRPESGDYTYHYYYSREHSAPDLRPRLVVNYTVGVVTPTHTPTIVPALTPGTAHRVYLPVILKQWTAARPTPTSTPTVPIPSQLIQTSDMTYEGAFRLPDGPPEIGWEWNVSASAMAYYPEGDPHGPADGYPGSIFGTGHDFNQFVSEISIPVPVNSPGKNVDQLNSAATLQEFHDIRAGMFQGLEIPRVGLEYLPVQGAQATGKLYFCWAQHMGEGDTNPSHGWCELDLSNPQTAGAWRIGSYWNYVTTDYIFAIPRAWADANTPGMYLATGRFRDGGQGGQGPSAFAYGPWNQGNPPAPGTTLPAVPLLLYGNVYTPQSPRMNDYHHSDEWSGGAWLTAGDKAAVIFVGTKGTGDCWYGCSDGTVWPDEPPFPPECPERGWWSSGFVGQIIFYDPADLAAVANGQKETWEPQPYATVAIDPYLYHVTSTQQKEHVGAASFDRQRGLLYVFEPLADGEKSLVHVWKVNG
jgi:hypothetical protein